MTATRQTEQRLGSRGGPGQRIAIIALTCATAVWGWSYITTVWLLPEMGTPSLVAVRFVLAGLIMVAIRPRAILSLGRRHTLAGLGLAFFLGSGTLLQVQGQHYIPASQSGFLVSLFVVLTPLVARVLFRTKVTKGVWAGVLVATGGLAVISFNGVALGLGSWLTLAAALSYSIQVAFLSEYSAPDKVYGLATLQILGTGVIASCWAVPSGIDLPDTPAGWGWLAYSTLMATLGMYAVQTWAQSRVSAAGAAVVLACEPLFVAVFSLLVGASLTGRTVIGGMLILVAMFLVVSADRSVPPPLADPLALPEPLTAPAGEDGPDVPGPRHP
ncbi:putative DMT superfamily transporter inner membrane protein [Streptomyces sp. ADI96-02]|uniref:DMT family transporter n=1 Tax=Streptomyces sp. ADI96-02 TaxID=1522760 RepID=UPI000F554F42|nr:DMT family transporter [Streptomyces sp. ADI96-02]RPK69199.1 putative DMT superfamily transporter inner membrane protein [Streptomyces sp. ADI96-02]